MPEVRGVELGVSDSGLGMPLFWGHGFASSRALETSGSLLDFGDLAGRHRVVRWDARGHGESGGGLDPAEYTWDNLGRDLLGLADALAVDRFVASGVSMGTATALHAAVLAPERVAGLVLVLPPTAYETRAAQADEYRRGAELVEREGVDRYVERVASEPVPEILRAVAAGYRFTPAVAPERLPAVLRGAGASDLPPPDAVRAIAVPALVLAWESDAGHPLASAERLAGLLPDAELHVARRLRDVTAWTRLVDGFVAGRAAADEGPGGLGGGDGTPAAGLGQHGPTAT